MEPEERKMLEELLRISQHNNRILRRMRHEVLIGRFIHIFYWVAIFAIAYGAYYYIRPYLTQLTQAVQSGNYSQIQLPGKQ